MLFLRNIDDGLVTYQAGFVKVLASTRVFAGCFGLKVLTMILGKRRCGRLEVIVERSRNNEELGHCGFKLNIDV